MAEAAPQERSATKRARARLFARVQSLDSLIAAHPDALRDIYGSGKPADSSTLDEVRGRLLTITRFASTYNLTRPIVKTLATRLLPWRGKVFESGGTSGTNRVLSWNAFRFRCQAADSLVDGEPTLALSYDGLGNPWPVSRIVDELRVVGEGVAIGPAFYMAAEPQLIFWWGVTY